MSTPPLTPDGIENRKDPRYPVSWPARLDLGGGQILEVKVRDISESGLGLRSPRPLPEKVKMPIAVGVPDLTDPTRLQGVTGTVGLVFVVMSGHEWRIGAQWLELDPAPRHLLRQWMTRLRFG